MYIFNGNYYPISNKEETMIELIAIFIRSSSMFTRLLPISIFALLIGSGCTISSGNTESNKNTADQKFTAEEIFEKYYAAIDRIENITYQIHTIDTFTSGEVWNQTGYCSMKRGESKTMSGFLFMAYRDDVKIFWVFDGMTAYFLDTQKKSYQFDSVNISTMTLTGFGVIPQEMVIKIVDFNKLSYEETDSSYVLKFEWPPNDEYQMRNRYKELHLHKDSFLPFYCYHYLEAFGEKQANRWTLSNVVVNSPDYDDPFAKDFLQGYINAGPQYGSPIDHTEKIINVAAPGFELNGVDSLTYKLSAAKNKIILINFWEIWCGPCIQSIGELKELVAKYPEDKFEIWSIVSDQKTFPKVKTIVDRKEINYAVLFGNVELAQQYFVTSVPVYIIVDTDGIVRHAQLGYSSEIEKKLDQFF